MSIYICIYDIYIYIDMYYIHCILSLMCLNYMSKIHVHTDPKKMVLKGVSVLCSAVTVWEISQVAGWEIPNKMEVLTWKYGKITYIWRFIAGNNDTNDDTWWHDETLIYIYVCVCVTITLWMDTNEKGVRRVWCQSVLTHTFWWQLKLPNDPTYLHHVWFLGEAWGMHQNLHIRS